MNILLTFLAGGLRLVGLLLGPGGLRAVIAENLLLKQQLLVLNRVRKGFTEIDILKPGTPNIDSMGEVLS